MAQRCQSCGAFLEKNTAQTCDPAYDPGGMIKAGREAKRQETDGAKK